MKGNNEKALTSLIEFSYIEGRKKQVSKVDTNISFVQWSCQLYPSRYPEAVPGQCHNEGSIKGGFSSLVVTSPGGVGAEIVLLSGSPGDDLAGSSSIRQPDDAMGKP